MDLKAPIESNKRVLEGINRDIDLINSSSKQHFTVIIDEGIYQGTTRSINKKYVLMALKEQQGCVKKVLKGLISQSKP